MTIDLKAAVLKGAEKIDERTTFAHDRDKYMNASEAGRCIRRQWYEKHGTKPETEQDWGYARRGTHGEKYIIEALTAARVDITFTGEDQTSLQDEELKVSGTPDGIIWVSRNEIVVPEFKTIDPRTNVSKLPKPEHVEQNKICQHLVQKSWDELPKKNRPKPRGGVILYMDASNYNVLYQFDVPPPSEADLTRWKRRASKILRTKVVSNLDREGKTTGECRYCPFVKTCGVQLDEKKGGRANRGSKFHAAAERIVEVKNEKKVLEQEEAELKETIKDELTKRQITHTTVGNIEITLSTVAGRTTLDRKAAEKAGIDLTPFEKQSAPSERLEIKQLTAA